MTWIAGRKTTSPTPFERNAKLFSTILRAKKQEKYSWDKGAYFDSLVQGCFFCDFATNKGGCEMKISERLSQLRGELGISQPAAATKFHIPPILEKLRERPKEPGAGHCED